MSPLLKFLQYNNAVPIAVSLVLLGAGGAFAATDPGAIYSSSQQVVSIDNTYIVNKDLSTYSPQVQIISVSEDSTNYYVNYNFYTIDLKNGVWQDVTKNEIMNVSKADLGQYRDLGLYVTDQLKQITDRELSYLKQVQAIEQKNVTQKVVATQYGGLVGKFLNTTTEEIPGYTPIVQGPPDTSPQTAAAAAPSTPAPDTSSPPAASPTNSGNPSLRIQVLGNTPAQIPLHSSYVDLGAVVTDAANDNIGIHTLLNGTEVAQITIDTSTTSVSTVTYSATDPQGNTVSIDRKVYVYDPAVGQPFPDAQTPSVPLTPVSNQTPTPTSPAPTPDTSASSTPPDTSGSNTSTTTSPDTSASTTPPDSNSGATSTTP